MKLVGGAVKKVRRCWSRVAWTAEDDALDDALDVSSTADDAADADRCTFDSFWSLVVCLCVLC